MIYEKHKQFGFPKPRNCVLFIMDSVPAYAFKNAEPKYFTKLLESFNGYYYEAWSPCNWTLPAMTSFMCGRLAHYDGSEQMFPQDYEMVKNMNKAGWNTYFFSGLSIGDLWPYKNDFKWYKNYFKPDCVGREEINLEDMIPDLKELKEPYFAVFLISETHYWFETPSFTIKPEHKIGLGRFFPRQVDKSKLAFLREKQVEAVKYVDSIFEKMHPLFPGNPVVVITADHGTVLREDCDRYFHAWGNHPDMFKVPLLIYNIPMTQRLDFEHLPA